MISEFEFIKDGQYQNGEAFLYLTKDRGNPRTPIVTRDALWNISYHRPDGTCVNGYSTALRDIDTQWKLSDADVA